MGERYIKHKKNIAFIINLTGIIIFSILYFCIYTAIHIENYWEYLRLIKIDANYVNENFDNINNNLSQITDENRMQLYLQIKNYINFPPSNADFNTLRIARLMLDLKFIKIYDPSLWFYILISVVGICVILITFIVYFDLKLKKNIYTIKLFL